MIKSINRAVLYNSSLVKYVSFIGFAVSLWVVFIDVPLLPLEQKSFYIIGRLVTSISCFVVFISNFYKPYPWQVPLTFLSLMMYSIHGQYFLPCYYLAYMEIVIPLGIFFQMRRRLFYSLIWGSFILMILIIVYSKASYSTDPQVTTKFKFDASMGVIITTILSILGYRFITQSRLEREVLMEKFLDLGCHTSSIMHDFKGLLTTPITYAELLSEAINQLPEAKNKEEVVRTLDFLKEDLGFLTKYANEINALNHVSDKLETFELSSIINVLQTILRGSLKGTIIEIEGDPVIKFSKSMLIKTLYNIVMNSIEARILKNQHKIKITYSEKLNLLTIQDNGPGFKEDVLKNLNAARFITSNKENRGIGIYLVRRLLEASGSSIKFQNAPQGGALLTIKFP